jgi:hypothetical protein
MEALILFTFLPNVIVPILNYQFYFISDQSYASEESILHFFAYLKGALNGMTFLILLFMGQFYRRWGLSFSFFFHPVNNPARAAVLGLFPARYRKVIRPFLRGTVVRLGLLLGAGTILLSRGRVHPQYVSLFALSFGVLWAVHRRIFQKKI